jgi:hypothetical protein
MSDTINEWDVLFGRGGVSNTHIGNCRVRKLIAQAQPEYLAARKKDKILIAQRIVKATQANGGRFLMRSSANGSDQWVEVCNARAIAKASQGLREGLDVRRKQFRPTKIYKHTTDDTDLAKRPRVQGKVITTQVARDVSPDHTPANSPTGPRPVSVPSHNSIMEFDRINCSLPDMIEEGEDYCIDGALPRLGFELQNFFDI